MSVNDSDRIAPTTLDHVLLLIVALAGLAAFAVQWLLGLPATDLLALMIGACAGLVYLQNLRLVALLKRQRHRKEQGNKAAREWDANARREAAAK